MPIELKTYNEILGSIVRKMIADSPVNDINRGSVLLTLLEAVAASDFDNNAAILNVLETLNIDTLSNVDLDNRAADYGLTRSSAQRATGFVKITDSSITKRSTTLYSVKAPPIAGSTVLYVNNAYGWSPTGQIYIGRGTSQFEGPIAYTSIINNGSFYTINLASSLQKDHLLSDLVIDGQGTTNRLIRAGTLVKIPANNKNPEVSYTILRDAVIPAGEVEVSDIAIVATKVGKISNTGINTIVLFGTLPFAGATVTNTSALIDGKDIESDNDLRERIKSYTATLARGTRTSILAAIVGVSDATDGKQVVSAVLTEPAQINQPSILYLDDGTGFQPSYAGQPDDMLLASAVGDESFLQLANFPIPRPQVVNLTDGPYELKHQSFLSVEVDSIEERVYFNSSSFSNITAASLIEIASVINNTATLFRCRLTENSSRLLLYPVDSEAETIQVLPYRSSDDENLYANTQLKFPTNIFSYIKLYLNNRILTSKEKSAFVLSLPFNEWTISGTGNLVISVDSTPEQDRSFTSLDFDGLDVNLASLEQWASAINHKFAGITATTTSSGQLKISSNRIGLNSSIALISGSLLPLMFNTDDVSSIGAESEFLLNRQTGMVQIKTDLTAGDVISAGSSDTKGFVNSNVTSTGTYNLSTDTYQRSAVMIMCADGDITPRTTARFEIGQTLTIVDMGNDRMRILSSGVVTFQAAQIDDFIYITNRGDTLGTGSWVAAANCGLFKIISKGDNTTAGVDSFIEVKNTGIIAGGPYSVIDSNDVQIFQSNTYPMLWKSSFLPSPASTSLSQLTDSINNNLTNVKASVYKTNSVKVTSATEENGSIALPVSVGQASLVFNGFIGSQTGNPSHAAAMVTTKDLISSIRLGDLVTSNIWLNRAVRGEKKDVLLTASAPGEYGVTSYSDQLNASMFSNIKISDLISVSDGNNSQHFRSIKEIFGTLAYTQHEKPRTLMDYTANDTIQAVVPLTIASDDSIVFIVDKDEVGKTINVNMWRSGRVNSQYPASITAFSADDADNEPGINFGNVQIWSTSLANTEFKDYSVWFRSRNWYRTGGALSSGATMILRSNEYGKNGDKLRFAIDYPSAANQSTRFTHVSNPAYTIATMYLASGAERVTGIIGGSTFRVTSPSTNIYRYIFQQSYIDLSQVVIGDVFSVADGTGTSSGNRGQFNVLATNVANKTIDVYNPNGSVTAIGQQEISSITTTADIAGAPARHTIKCTAEGSTASTVGSSEYFVLYDDVGIVVFWYDINNAGAAAPTIPGATRYVEISTIITGDSANSVASKTAAIIASDTKFTATVAADTITVDNTFNGNVTAGYAGPNIGFTITKTISGVDTGTLGGKYFVLNDKDGSVAVWYSVYGEFEPPHGKDRSIQVMLVAGDSDSTIASKTAAQLDADSEFIASSLTNVVTVTCAINGARDDISSGTSGFTVSTVQDGIDDEVETIASTSTVKIFPLKENSVKEITTFLNTTAIINAVPVGDDSLLITKATRDEIYSWSGNTSALAYDHNPDPSFSKNSYISMFDGLSYVKTFSNSSPQFVLKTALSLQGIVPTIYNMSSCPNPDGTTGELFKLVPVTIPNIHHHLTHKALSQLPLITNVDIVDAYRKIQVKSKVLGSQGAIEVVGGRANNAEFSIFGDGQLSTYSGDEYAELKIAAYPYSINTGDIVKVFNTIPAKRYSRLSSTDTIDVDNPSGTTFRYMFNEKKIFSSPFTKWSISDVSAVHSRPVGTVWRWTHNEAGASVFIKSITNGVIASFPPTAKNATGSADAVNLKVFETTNGTATTQAQFYMTVSDIPSSGDHFLIEAMNGDTFGVWFDLTGSDPLPSNPVFTATDYKIRVNISGLSTVNTIVSKLALELIGSVNFTNVFYETSISGTDLSNVNIGDILDVFGTGSFFTTWSMCNLAREAGSNKVSGFPIIAVNVSSRYMDVVNPNGTAMSSTLLGLNGRLSVYPSLSTRWWLSHSSKVKIEYLSWSSTGSQPITVQTDTPHLLKVGDTVTIDSTNGIFDGNYTVISTPSVKTFVFTGTHSGPAGTIMAGTCIRSDKTVTRYTVEKIGFNNLIRLKAVTGDSPRFIDNGCAIDDVLLVSGTTFDSKNNGRFRIIALDNDSLVFINDSAIEQKHRISFFNDNSVVAQWTEGLDEVSGVAGVFKFVNIGDWVKKETDSIDQFCQVIGFNNPSQELATVMYLGCKYAGSTSLAVGVRFDQVNDVRTGVDLLCADDISVLEGDSAFVTDSIVVENIVNTNWFSTVNSGVFDVIDIGTDDVDHRPYISIMNSSGVIETNRTLSVKSDGIYLLESNKDLFETLRIVEHSAINPLNTSQRILYMQPANKIYKMSNLYSTKITSMGKIGFNEGVVTGVDGYLYYTGLLRTAQRLIDGFEPDLVTYPGLRAVGSTIEILPPLVKQIDISINVTTKEGVNINDINNDIKSSIINYINNLGVGEDVIMSEIIARVMQITGIAAVTFTTPLPSNERIAIADDQKAQVIPDRISIS